MADRHQALWQALEDSILKAAAHTAPEERQAACAGGPLPPELQALVEKIRRHAYRVTDEDLAALAKTRSQDQLFELVIAAAFGAARERLRAGLRAIEEA